MKDVADKPKMMGMFEEASVGCRGGIGWLQECCDLKLPCFRF